MVNFFKVAAILACILYSRAEDHPQAEKCLDKTDIGKHFTLSIHCHGIETGELWTNFTALRDSDNKDVPQGIKPTWAYYHGSSYYNGRLAVKDFGKSLNELVIGDRVGMMRSSAGNLHFYVNGVDQGPVASNVSTHIYGVLELFHNAAIATIVNP